MKILRIRFANLNSLVGEWDIDLTLPAFQSDGIFAITGPTGAGKSTILDAICLALYARTPRLERVNKSGNEILSRHTAACFAEVTFETQNGRYRCHWSQHRARHRADGALQIPQHEIANAESGDILDAQLSKVALRVVEVTGMDFERFTRSMLLAQGHFAAFLQSSPDARAPILEQITGTALYSRISVAVHERLGEEKQSLQALQSECAGLTLLDDEQEAALREQLAQRRAQEQAAETALRASRQALDWVEELAALEHALEEIRARRAAHEEELTRLVPERERLQSAQRAAGLDGEYAALTALRSRRAESAALARELEQALPAIEARAGAAGEALEQAERASADAQAAIAAQKPRLQALRALDQQLASQASQVATAVAAREEERAALELAQAAVQRARNTEASAAAALTVAQARLDAHAAQSQDAQRAASDTLAAAQAEQAAASAVLHDLLDGRRLHGYYEDKSALLRESFRLSRIAELEEQRARLVAGEPCPLCGSTEHPFAEGEVPTDDGTQRRLAEVEAHIERIQGQQETLAATEARVTAAQREQASAETTLTRAGEALLAQKVEAEKRQQAMRGETGTAEALLAARQQAYDKAERQWHKAESALQTLRDTRQSDYGDLDADAEERRAERALEQAQRSERAAREQRDAALLERHRTADKLQDVRAALSRLGPQLDQRESAWRSTLQGAGFEDDTGFLAARLEPAEREALAQRLKEVDERGVALGTQLRDSEARLATARARELTDQDVPTLQAELSARQESLTQHQTERAALAHRLSENERAAERLREQQARIEAQQSECRRWEALHALIGSADGKKYRNFAQGLTFDMMIVQANQQLQRMSDRYLLVRDAEQPLELNVIDNYQAGEVRSTRNLSGGESFLVSLALALGLSRMASRNVRVDSLFLDEGFGTLDEDALDTALETLSGLQQEGKLIGVISHVPALKERIATQIRVIPLSGGRSRIEVAT